MTLALQSVFEGDLAPYLPQRDQFSDDAATPAFRAIGTVMRFAPNETIFAEGDNAEYVYKILSGGARLCKMLADGRRQITDFVLLGDHFGFECGCDYTITAEALGPVSVLRCSRTRIDRLQREQHDVRQSLVHMLMRDLWAAQNHLLMLGRQTAKERVASFLLLIAGRRKTDYRKTIDIPMSRQDIADYLGLTIETVCRELGDLKRDRVVGVPNRHQITIRDTKILETIAQGGD